MQIKPASRQAERRAPFYEIKSPSLFSPNSEYEEKANWEGRLWAWQVMRTQYILVICWRWTLKRAILISAPNASQSN